MAANKVRWAVARPTSNKARKAILAKAIAEFRAAAFEEGRLEAAYEEGYVIGADTYGPIARRMEESRDALFRLLRL